MTAPPACHDPLLPPHARSRTALGLAAAAAEGRFMLQVCADCGATLYPPRDACPRCWSARVGFQDVPRGGAVLADTTIRTSTDPYFRERTPWRIGAVALDCGPVVVAHLHGGVAAGARVRMALRLDKAGNAAATALADPPAPGGGDDPLSREMACNPRSRRVLVTDGRSAVGQAMAQAFASAGASAVFVGLAGPCQPFAGEAALRGTAAVETVPLDVTDSQAVSDLAGHIGHRVDILVNTAGHARPGGIVGRAGVTAAQHEIDVRYLGLMRLAQAFGPAMRARSAEGTAFVNLLSVHALAAWPAYGAFSAAEAACLSASHTLRAELRGVRVLNVFAGPLDTECFQGVPPPKVSPAALAAATVRALQDGTEDAYAGDVAQDLRLRLAASPKTLERELGQ